MRFNTQGRAVCGVGDAVVSVDNQPIPGSPVSGECGWIDDGQIGYRYRDDRGVYRLGRWVIGTPTTDVLDLQSATTFRGGGDGWAAFLVGSGVRASDGRAWPLASLCDVSPGGWTVLCPNYQEGRNLDVYDHVVGTAILHLVTGALGQDATAGPNVRLRGDVLTYQADNVWWGYRLGTGPVKVSRKTPINYMVPILMGSELYLLEREDARLTLRNASGTAGWVIATGEALWAPDAVQVVAGAILVGLCSNPSETPGSLVTVSQRLDAPMVDLEPTIVDPTVPPTSPIVTFPGYVPPPQASYGRKGYSGPYFATDLRTGNFSTPGNMEMIVNGTVLAGNQQVTRPVLVSLQSTGNDPAKMLGFLAGANDNSLGNAGIRGCWNWALTNGYPKSLMVRYYDGTPIPTDFLAGCEREAVVQVQCYPRDGESVSQSMARFVEAVDKVIASNRRAGIARAFNTKFGSLRQVLDVQDPLCAMARVRPQVILDAWFSHGRYYRGVESGAAYCAELLAWEPILGGLFTGLP